MSLQSSSSRLTASVLGALFMLFAFSSCQNTPGNQQEVSNTVSPRQARVDSFLKPIEHAYNKKAYYSHQAVTFNISLAFQDSNRINGTILMTPDMGKIELMRSDGSELIWDGKNLYSYPDSSLSKHDWFDIFTWPYFFSFPYKMRDPGTGWDIKGMNYIQGRPRETAMLTFKPGTGISPNDWYYVYSDTTSHLIDVMAYVVTFGNKRLDVANENPHAIVYSDYTNVGNCPIAGDWRFWNWSPSQQLHNLIGEATIRNVKFIDGEKDLFALPKGAYLVPPMKN